MKNGGKSPHHLGHRKRLRERFRNTASDGLHPYELLELLLTYAIPRRDVKAISKALIVRFGSLPGVLDATQMELENSSAIGPTSATLIRLIKALCGAYLASRIERRDLLSSPREVVDFCKVTLSGLAHEAFMVIYLNTKNEAVGHEIVHEGTIDRAVIYPRRLIEAALAHHAAGLILVHNHPSGDPAPSDEDRRLTRTMIEATRAMDIRILDHIIVGRDRHFSFLSAGLL